MKTRVINTDIFRDELFTSLNIDTRYLYLTTILNPDISQTRIYKCPDSFLEMYSGIPHQQIEKCKNDLDIAGLAFFKDGWICVGSDIGFVRSYYSGAKNISSQVKEFENIPKKIIQYFVTQLLSVGIDYQYTIDSTINLNLNNKSKYEKKKEEESNNKYIDDPQKAKDFFETVLRK